jgi:uncharacterized membrane protein YvlD (DUF360 family)
MLKLASAFVPGFNIQGFPAAFLGTIVLSLVNMLLKWLVMPSKNGACRNAHQTQGSILIYQSG